MFYTLRAKCWRRLTVLVGDDMTLVQLRTDCRFGQQRLCAFYLSSKNARIMEDVLIRKLMTDMLESASLSPHSLESPNEIIRHNLISSGGKHLCPMV